jgi:hypothetical protein
VEKLTLVTGLFDLATRDRTERRSIADYMQLGQFLFALDQDIVFFIDSLATVDIMAERRKFGLEHRTHVIRLGLEDLHCYHRYAGAISGLPRPIGCTQVKDTTNYTLVGWAKFELLQLAMELNPFDATHFGWVDFGITHVVDVGGPASAEPFLTPYGVNDLVKINMLRYFGPKTVIVPEYFSRLQQNVAGGFFTGNKTLLTAVCKNFWAAAELAMNAGHRPLELDLLAYLAVQNPSQFTYSYGDYQDLFRNHKVLRRNAKHVLWIMRSANEHQDWKHVCAIGKLAMHGYQRGEFDVPADVYEQFLFEYSIAAYWKDYPYISTAVLVMDEYAEEARLDPKFRAAFRAHEDLVRRNFSYLPNPALLP